MHKLLRYYSQNRIKVWAIGLAVIFIIMIIQVLNNWAIEEKSEEEETTDDVVSYQNESESIITEGSVPQIYRERFGNVIDEFYTYCINHEPQKAYDLLAPDTKKVLYQTEEQFEKLYYQEKFEGNKDYSFQSWTRSSDNIYIYQVKIFENMLVTGKANNKYIEDFVTIVPVEDSYKINIDSYIGRKERNKKQSNEQITAEVTVSDRYLEYEVYTIRIQNNTDQALILDTRKNIDTTYITDDNGNRFESFLYELPQKDLTLKPREIKTISIKFNVAYHNELTITSINFTDIVEDGKEGETNTLKVNL